MNQLPNYPIIDSHCHLNFPDFSEDVEEVIARAHASGICMMQTICTHMGEFESIHALAMRHDSLVCSVGVHPHSADKEPLVEVAHLIECATRPKVVGIGETGLDYYYEYSKREVQQESFRRHIAAARALQRPVIVHTRDAEEDTLRILEEEMSVGEFPILIHCFTSTQRLADAVIAMGGYISISGIVTFKKATELQETVRTLPIERLLIETDSPFLAPMPHRGKRNEPAFTRHVCAKVAELQGITEEECARITTDNFMRLFRLC
ncbi:MAG: TatD family deoxyribonuclease [Alphaproteobacteria bacterium]|nr:MAG: TatD family deoxyribonuclease [Alphaproteobacteria bacterium]